MRAGVLSILGVSLSAVACSALAQDGPRLTADGPWTLVYDDDSCALRRTFGEGDQQGYLEMRRFAPGIGLQVLVASDRLKARDIYSYQYRWGGEPEWREAGRLKITLESGLGGVVFNTALLALPEDSRDFATRQLYMRSTEVREIERQAAGRTDLLELRGATVRGARRGDTGFQLGNLEEPITALNSCIDELVTHWGIDVEAHKTLTRPAVPIEPAEAASMVGYPPKMARRGMPGLVNVRLSINETGLVTGCRIQMPLSDPEFEASSCADIQHAFEFEPALDKDGKPIASYWITTVVFQIAG